MDRIRAASKKNPTRKWRRFPAKKGTTFRETVEARKPQPFEVGLVVEDGLAHFEIINRSGHTERVAIVGTEPEVFIEVDGNHEHSASLPVGAGSATVEVRRQGRNGEILVSVDLSAPQESQDEHESPEPPQPLPGSESGSP